MTKTIKTIKNSYLNVVKEIGQLNFISNIYKAPINNMITQEINLREQLYTFRWQQLNYRYSTDGIFNTLIRQPVLDALRNGIIIHTEQLEQEEIQKLENRIEEKNIIDIVKQTFIWNRLFGGSGIIIENINEEMEEVFNINSINKESKINYYSINRWELSNQYSNTSNQLENELSKYDDDYYYYYGVKIDKSKLLTLKGVEAPLFVRQLLQGWGLSIAEPLIAPSNIYQKSVNLIYELIDQAKLDIYSIEGLKESVGSGNDKQVVDQIQLTNILKNFQNAIVLDKEDTYEQRQLQLSGLVDIIKELKLDICSAVRIPAVILWGMSPSGFSSGEFDLKSYYGEIESELRPKIKRMILKILKIECMNLFEMIPDDLDIEFNQLLIQTEEQVQNSKEKVFNRLMTLYNQQLLTKKELFDSLKKEDLFINKVKASEEDEYNDNNFNDKLNLDGNEIQTTNTNTNK